MSDAGEEHHLVLEGTIRLRQGDFVTELGPGDYLVWDGCFPHQAENTGESPARLLIITPGPSAVGISPVRQKSAQATPETRVGRETARRQEESSRESWELIADSR